MRCIVYNSHWLQLSHRLLSGVFLYTYTGVGLSALLVSTYRAMRRPIDRGTSDRTGSALLRMYQIQLVICSEWSRRILINFIMSSIIKSYFATGLFLLGGMAMLASCSKSDDNGSGDGTGGDITSCLICSYKESLNSFLIVNGVRYHTGTSSTQYLGTERGSYMDTQLHKDNGSIAVTDYFNVAVTLSKQSGSSIDNVTVGQKLLLESGIDKVQAWHSEDIGKEITYGKYISGSITCTAKSGTLTTLAFSDVVLENTKDNSQVTINGSLIYEEYK